MSASGDELLVLRLSLGVTQEELASQAGITQAALSRYESGMRAPTPEVLERLAECLGVTPDFLSHDYQRMGAVAVDAHMRRRKTGKPTEWKRVEARLNVLRMQAAYLLSRVSVQSKNHVPLVDTDEQTPTMAAEMVRAAWKMPVGPVRNLTKWIEAAGVIVVEEDFGTSRVDGMSQWSDSVGVILLNERFSTDRKRLTLAHELGHLVLHTEYPSPDAEAEANEFAAALLMPAHVIGPDLKKVTLQKLADLKVEWGVSIQALVQRAFGLNLITSHDRQALYKRISAKGWRTHEPKSDLIPPENPEFAPQIGEQMRKAGLSDSEIRRLSGTRAVSDRGASMTCPFLPAHPVRHLHAV